MNKHVIYFNQSSENAIGQIAVKQRRDRGLVNQKRGVEVGLIRTKRMVKENDETYVAKQRRPQMVRQEKEVFVSHQSDIGGCVSWCGGGDIFVGTVFDQSN